MATTYIHKRTSVATNQPVDNIPNGELFVNLASGKVRSTRSIIEGTFVGTVATATTSTVTFESDVPAFLAGSTQSNIVLRSTTSGTVNNAPAISTIIFGNSGADAQTIDYAATSLKGDMFLPGDFVWAELGAAIAETIVVSGHSSASAIPPAGAEAGDIWVNIGPTTPVINIMGTDGDFAELVTGSGDTDFEGADLATEGTTDMDFGMVNMLVGNTALDVTYSAVDYDFGGVNSPRPGPDFGVI